MKKINLICLSTLIFLSGCVNTPELKVPTFEKPTMQTSANSLSQDWWKLFKDDTLNALVDEALKNNDDLKLAISRIERAREVYGLSEANEMPNITGNAGFSRDKLSKQKHSSAGDEFSDHKVSLSARYEFDFWDKLKNQTESDRALFLSTQSKKETLQISLVADVVKNYFKLVSLHVKAEILNKTVETYRQTYEFRQKQYQLGAINELVLAQSKAQYASAKVAMQPLKESIALQNSALNLLLGREPKSIFEKSIAMETKLPLHVSIPSGLSSSLLENRPDIKDALEVLKSKNALIGVEKAAYFPSISLSGTLGLQSEELGNILKSGAGMWSFGPSLSVPIFDFERIKTRVKISEADLKIAMIEYEKTVKNAYREVFDALEQNAIARQKLSLQEEEKEAYAKTLALASKRFELGKDSYLEVLDAQKGVLNTSLLEVTAKEQVLNYQVALFKALGGGWKN
ncbi:MAG: TolC family protein [Sulfurospirillaceae bacterium]|nr:TolC family protein [Sulfurospirillaceae bacterium]